MKALAAMPSVIIMGATALAWVISVVLPAVALVGELGAPSTIDHRPLGSLLATSLGWAVIVAALAAIVGWIPGRVCGELLASRRWLALALGLMLLMTPLAMPSYLVFYAWWQSWPVETPLHQWVIAHGLMQTARQATLLLGLVCWGWPLVSLCVMGATARRPAWRDELLVLDGAGRFTRIADRLRTDGSGLLLGSLLVFLATLANTTCFDLAEVFTFANELRAIEALGASPGDLLVAGWPAIALVTLGAVATALAMRTRKAPIGERTGKVGAMMLVITLMTWLLTTMAPLGTLVMRLARHSSLDGIVHEFLALYGSSVRHTVGVSMISGLVAVVVCLGLLLAFSHSHRIVRAGAAAMSLAWLVVALAPGTLTGRGLVLAFEWPMLAWLIKAEGSMAISDSILVAGHLAAFGIVPAFAAWWVASSEPARIRDLRRIDGVTTFSGLAVISWPRWLGALAPAGFVTAVLALGEIPITAMVNQPHRAGAGPVALSILNDMHYQRPQSVMVAAVGMAALGLLAAGVTAAAIVVLTGIRKLSTFAWTGSRIAA